MEEVIIDAPARDEDAIRIPERLRIAVMLCGGVVILLLSGLLIVHGMSAGLAQAMYYEAKFGSSRNDLNAAIVLCEKAQQAYPYNYYFPMWTGERSYYSTLGAGKGERADCLLSTAEKWCNIGLALNSYRSQLRVLEMRLKERKSLPDAIKYWEEFVKWQFWAPYNHAVLVELYSKAGEIEKAYASLNLIREFPCYETAARQFKDAWAKDVSFTRSLSKPRKPRQQ